MNTQKILLAILLVNLIFKFNQSNAQVFQQSEFMIGTYGETQMELSSLEISQHLNGTLSGSALTSFNTRKNNYINHLTGIKNAHFNLMSGVLFQNNFVWGYRNDEILYSLELLSTTPSLSGLRRLIMNPNLFGNINASTSPSMIIPGWSPATYSNVYMNVYHPSGTDYGVFCPSGNCDNVVYGFHTLDEPELADRENLHEWGNYVNTQSPGKTNFFNYSGGAYWGDISTSSGKSGYENHMNAFLSPTSPTSTGYSPDIVPFAYYPFSTTYCEANPYDAASLAVGANTLKNYFWGLSKTRDLAGDKPLWCFPLSTEHTNRVPVTHRWLDGYINTCSDILNVHYTNPTYNHIMFMDFCPLAYGAKGLFYFTYDQVPNNSNFNNAITDPVNGTCTQRYEEVKNINHYIKNIVGPVVMQHEWVGAFHKSNSPTNETDLTSTGSLADDLITSSQNPIIADVNNNDILFGVFKAQLDNCYSYYLLVVNKNLTGTSPFSVTLKGNWSGINRIMIAPAVGTPPVVDASNPCGPYSYNGLPYNGSINYTGVSGTYSSISNTTTFTMPDMQGGEGRMILLDKCSQSSGGGGDQGLFNTPSDFSDDIKLTISPNPSTQSITKLEFFLTDQIGVSTTEVKVINEYGIEIFVSEKFSPQSGLNSFNLNTSEMSSGLYHVLLYLNGVISGHKTLQIIK